MSLPGALGLSPLGGPHQEPEDYLRLLIRLQGDGGYSTDPDSLRVKELRALAVVASVAACAVERAGEQGFVDRVTELLSEWERVYNLPNDAARTDEQRRERLQLTQSSAVGAGEDTMEALLAEYGVTVDLRRGAIGTGLASFTDRRPGEEAELVYHTAALVSDSVLDNPRLRKTLARLLERFAPARHVTHYGLRDPEEMMVSEGTAKWGSTTQVLGRTAIGKTAESDNYRFPARVRSYGKNSRIRAEDLNAWQEGVLWEAGAGLGNMTDVEGAWVFCEGTLADTDFIFVDDSIHWDDRFVEIVGEIGGTTVSEIVYFGSGGSSYDANLIIDFRVYSNTSGQLSLQNNTGSSKDYSLMFRASPDLGER